MHDSGPKTYAKRTKVFHFEAWRARGGMMLLLLLDEAEIDGTVELLRRTPSLSARLRVVKFPICHCKIRHTVADWTRCSRPCKV